MKPYLLGIDQGGSGSRAMLIDSDGLTVGYGYRAAARLFPQPGWVEQDPRVIAESVRGAVADALAQAACPPSAIAACGITSQRDTVFAWSRTSGQPIGNAITWQDLRTTELVAETNRWALADQRRARLGQFPGAYCSAMHMAWRMRHDAAFRQAAASGDLACSLAAGWILQALGTPQSHVLDYSLLQGMTVLDFRRRQLWDAWIDELELPRAALPLPVPTIHQYGTIDLVDAQGRCADVPVLAMISDQQAALFGYDCRAPGQTACTHGTASFVNMVVGANAPPPGRTKIYLAWELADLPTYSLEADTTVTGAVVRWMQEQMGWLRQPADLGPLALSVPDSAGVVFVPAFTGLGIPTEDRSARGTLLGLTLDTTPAHIARAFLDSLGYQLAEILATMVAETGLPITTLHTGGGLATSNAVCQIQANLLGIPVARARNTETSVRAAALLAGLGVGRWRSAAELPPLDRHATIFEPQSDAASRAAGLADWQSAVERARGWRLV